MSTRYAFLVSLSLGLAFFSVGQADNVRGDLAKVYQDETHCLVGPEIRTVKDKTISCYCRDALADARYVYQTYLAPQKDSNLNGTYLTLERGAAQSCGKEYDVYRAARQSDWRWNGPEVIRTYPTDSEIEKLRPNGLGFRAVPYKVELVYRGLQRRSLPTNESFTAVELFPSKGKK